MTGRHRSTFSGAGSLVRVGCRYPPERDGCLWPIDAKTATQRDTVAPGPGPHAVLVTSGAHPPASDTPNLGRPANPARKDARPRREAGTFRDEHRRDLFPVTDPEHPRSGRPRAPTSPARTDLPARPTGRVFRFNPASDPRPGRCSPP